MKNSDVEVIQLQKYNSFNKIKKNIICITGIRELPSEKRIHDLLEYPLEFIDLLYFSAFHESSSLKVPWNISFTTSDSDELESFLS